MPFKQYGIASSGHRLAHRAGLLVLGRQVLARDTFSPFACCGDWEASGWVYAATILAFDLGDVHLLPSIVVLGIIPIETCCLIAEVLPLLVAEAVRLTTLRDVRSIR